MQKQGGATMKLTCDKCDRKAVGDAGHKGKKHQACSGRVKGSGFPRDSVGVWK